jgi:Tol biopolymer transport system component
VKSDECSKIAFCVCINDEAGAGRPLRAQLFVVNIDGSGLSRMDHLGDQCPATATWIEQPTWTSDNTSLTYMVSRWDKKVGGYVHTYHSASLADGSTRLLDRAPTRVSAIDSVTSPDGLYLAMLRSNDDDPGFVIATADGSSESLYAEELGHPNNFSWAPDSSGVLFTADDEDVSWMTNLWFFDLLSKKPVYLAKNVGVEPIFEWSPDSSTVCAVAGPPEGIFGLSFYMINRNGQERSLLYTQEDPTGELRAVAPAWAADSRYVAVSGGIADNNDVCRLIIYDKSGSLQSSLAWPEKKFSMITDLAWTNI